MKLATAKIREWLFRYGPAEIFSILGTLLASWLSLKLSDSKITMAFAGTWGGNIGYYGAILTADCIAINRKLKLENRTFSKATFLKVIRALLVEFGIAEAVDSFVARPLLLYYVPLWTDDLALGLVIGVITADVIFYVFAIIFYELSKKRLRKF